MIANYIKNEDAGSESLRFSCQWPIASTAGLRHQSDFESPVGSFQVCVNGTKEGDMISIMIKKDTGQTMFKRFKTLSLSNPNGSQTLLRSFVIYRSGEYCLDENIPVSLLEARDDHFELTVCLTTDAPLRPLQEPDYERNLLSKMYNEEQTYDIFLAPVGGMGTDSAEMDVSIEPMKKDTRSALSRCFNLITDKGSTDPTITSNHGQSQDNKDQETLFGSHKAVLFYYRFFRTLLESKDAQEISPGPLRITLKAVDADTLSILLRYIYEQQLPDQLATFTEEESDNAVRANASSWEKVYVAAKRYQVDRLQEAARAKLLNELDDSVAIPFLFRTAHRYEDLQTAVIDFVAEKSVSKVVKRSFRNEYGMHPKFVEIQSDLFAAFKDVVDGRWSCDPDD
ncbi:hypothetical protein BGZ82_005302 [Podila clonocystis]|nr:hypothetical protein BGZ82_005302 [Podila clonocystis]